MNQPYDAVLIIGFGGPETMADVRPFMSNILRGRMLPDARMQEVLRHYEAVGGRSPYNEMTFRQARGLETLLKERGRALPVYVGMRNWTPYLQNALQQMTADGIRRAFGIVLAPHQSEASWDRYLASVAQARQAVGPQAPQVDYGTPWFDEPEFIEAMADRVREALSPLAAAERAQAVLVFTAHSIPVEMARRSPYAAQFQRSAELVAERLSHQRWQMAYQSRSGRPEEAWLKPDMAHTLRALARQGARTVVVAPIGFLCDHMEVCYDLDIEAKQQAEALQLRFLRAGTVADHPRFLQMLVDRIALTVTRAAATI